MSGGYWLAGFRTETTAGDDRLCTQGLFTSVDTNFFSEMHIPLVQGRTFVPGDGRGAPVAVVSADVARRCWPGRSAIGQRLQRVNQPQKPWFTVIGVVGVTRSDGMDKPPVPHVYEPWAQNRWWWGPTEVVLRSKEDPMSLVAPLRRDLALRFEDAYILRLHRLGDLVHDSAWRMNYAAQLSAGLAAVSLLLAAIGIYGVLSHTVRERTREIGLRMALGASARHLGVFVTRQAFVAVAVGLFAGLGLSSGLVHSLRALLFGVEPLDPVTFAATGLVLIAVVLLAAAVPLRRAVRLAPITALRDE
jgi:putative ABC transport system permease protein